MSEANQVLVSADKNVKAFVAMKCQVENDLLIIYKPTASIVLSNVISWSVTIQVVVNFEIFEQIPFGRYSIFC